jgi:hypothetical protein
MGRQPQQRPQAPPQQSPTQIISLDRWKKMNTKLLRQNLPEDQLGWAENLQPIGENDWASVPGPGGSLGNVTGKIVQRLFAANVGATDYIIFFAIDGSCTAINHNNNAQTTIAGPGTFSKPDMTVYASQRILIMDPTGGYATWDGTLFVKGGGVSPNIQVTNGGTYAATPSVTITGGSGVGATAHAVMGGSGASQFVASVVLDTPGTGYKPGDVLTVNFTLAGGATATARIWPQTTGNTIAVFQGRVWWASPDANGNFRVLNFTGTQGYDDTATANAAGSTTLTDADLVHSITALRALNNYLYIFGDQSVRQIGNITVSSSVTLFTPLELASDIGTNFMMSVISYNRLVVFANKQGVYGIFGSTVQKMSDDLDGIFKLVNFTQEPSAALNDISNIHSYLLLVKYQDPVRGLRSIVCTLQGTQWFVVSQGDAVAAITTLASGPTTQIETILSSGADVQRMLYDATIAVPMLFKTSLTAHGELIRAKQAIRAGVAVTTQGAQNFQVLIETENGTLQYQLAAASVVNWVNNAQGQVNWQNNTPAAVQFIGGGYRFPYTDVDGYGKVLGATISGTVLGFSINAVAIEYKDADIWGSKP